MEFINEIWPFAPGQQRSLFIIPGFAVVGPIALNILSAIQGFLSRDKAITYHC